MVLGDDQDSRRMASASNSATEGVAAPGTCSHKVTSVHLGHSLAIRSL